MSSNVGKKGDIVDVANGFARNYLVPKGLALRATDGNVQQAGVDAEGSRPARREGPRGGRRGGAGARARDHHGAGQVGERRPAVRLGHDDGRGRSPCEEQTGIEVDRRKLQLDEPIKTVGTHQIPTKLHPDVEFAITVEVVSGT